MAVGRRPKKSVNWATVEVEFRTKTTPIVEIAQWFGVTEGTIRAHAKKHGWARGKGADTPRPEPRRSATLPAVVAAPAVETSDVKIVVGKGHDLVLRMLDELNAVTSNQGALEEMIYEDTASDRDGRRRASMLNAISLPTRALTIKALATAAKTFADTLKPTAGKGEGVDAQPPSMAPDADSWSSLLN